MKSVDEAVEGLLPILKVRRQQDGVCWIGRGEFAKFDETKGMGKGELGQVARKLSERLGVERLEDFGTRPQEFRSILRLCKKHNGWTSDAKQEMANAHPGYKPSGPIVASALKRLGLYEGPKSKQEPTIDVSNLGLADLAPMLAQYDKLLADRKSVQSQIHELEDERDKIDGKLGKFKRIASKLEELRTAIGSLKKDQETEALKNRGALS